MLFVEKSKKITTPKKPTIPDTININNFVNVRDRNYKNPQVKQKILAKFKLLKIPTKSHLKERVILLNHITIGLNLAQKQIIKNPNQNNTSNYIPPIKNKILTNNKVPIEELKKQISSNESYIQGVAIKNRALLKLLNKQKSPQDSLMLTLITKNRDHYSEFPVLAREHENFKKLVKLQGVTNLQQYYERFEQYLYELRKIVLNLNSVQRQISK